MNLLNDTHNLITESGLTTKNLAIYARVNQHWLEKFKQRKHPNPGVNQVQKVYDYLINPKH